MKYREKAASVDAYQWFGVSPYVEGVKRDVDYCRTSDEDGQDKCKYCEVIMHNHGYIPTMLGGYVVCPGDWIITGPFGAKYPIKPDEFEKRYEKV